jgi:hypothetical protein
MRIVPQGAPNLCRANDLYARGISPARGPELTTLESRSISVLLKVADILRMGLDTLPRGIWASD